MTDMIERVAVVIAWSVLSQIKGHEIHTDAEDYFHRQLPETEKVKFLKASAAALNAIREPTEDMEKAGRHAVTMAADTHSFQALAIEAFYAMIDTALKEVEDDTTLEYQST